jgi:hypothetical protein
MDNIKKDLLEIGVNVVESRRMRWAGHVARMGEKRNYATSRKVAGSRSDEN